MRPALRRVAFLLLACSLPGCDLDLDLGVGPIDISAPSDPASCAAAPADDWTIYLVGPFPIEVGSSHNLSIGPPLLYSGCVDQIRSVEWIATVDGVVSISPLDQPHQATLVGEARGRTHLLADVVLAGGHVRRARRYENEVVIVAPAPSGE